MTAATEPVELDFDAVYRHTGWGAGIAWRLIRHLEEPVEVSVECNDVDCPEWGPDDEPVTVPHWHYDVELTERLDLVVAHMVGDDAELTLDVSELVKIDEDGYCGGCGQIGCGW